MKNIEEILNGLDRLFEEQRMSEVEPYLQQELQEAMETKNSSAVITIVNELIGFYRDISEYEKSLYYCEQILPFMENQGLKDSIHYATTGLNVANAYRAAGKWKDSLKCYEDVKKVYDKMLTPTDSLYASYYNNLSLLYQEMGEFDNATKCLKTALVIMEAYGDRIKVAITCSNLAASLLRLEEDVEAEYYLSRALQIFKEDGERDFHYGAALSVMGELKFKKNQYEESLYYYKKALDELEKHVGKTEYYYRTLDNVEQVEKAIEKHNLKNEKNEEQEDSKPEDFTGHKSLSRQMWEDFYYEYGEPMLEEKFPEYLDKIAIGKSGEGSECFGYDDEKSMDHDFGPGFCMWVSRKTYEEIGKALETEYDKLPKTYRGITRKEMVTGKDRVGVCIIEDFYKRILGTDKIPESEQEWNRLEEFSLATATNGWVIKDTEGIFTGIRNQLLSYYPEAVWRSKIAQTMYSISQYGQYNYQRMAERGDLVTAEQCRSGFIYKVMEFLYLSNRIYSPYYKWRFKGLEGLEDFGISNMLKRLVAIPIMNIEENVSLIEHICIVLLENMERKGIIEKKGNSTYLEHYVGQILNYVSNDNEIKSQNTKVENCEKDKLVEQLVKLEWQNFDKVKNEGGRADCQDDWDTFSIMRTSQYMTWTKELLESYIQDFDEAMKKGWNLITEKYGRMMESTAPERFEEIKSKLPEIPEEKKAIIEAIVKIQVTWMEEFAVEYPLMAGNSRVIHSKEDSLYSTSFETYLRGEMGTYSDKTLDLYGRFIVSYLKEGKNLTKDIMTNTAVLYGYENLDKAEELLGK